MERDVTPAMAKLKIKATTLPLAMVQMIERIYYLKYENCSCFSFQVIKLTTRVNLDRPLSRQTDGKLACSYAHAKADATKMP